jgi:DNA-binding cell septation regulator SpoVG
VRGHRAGGKRGRNRQIKRKGKGRYRDSPPVVGQETRMKYAVKVNEAKKANGNVKGFATVVFGDSFKITNIAIVENKDKGQLFVSMPRYRSSEKNRDGSSVYKDVCNPITAQFREELYRTILEEYERVLSQGLQEKAAEKEVAPPEFSVTVAPFEREGSNIRGLARIYFEDSFIVNNVNILQGKEKVFVSMPSYKTKQKDENGKDVYQDICYPVTKEFRQKLYTEIERAYEEAKEKKQEQTQKYGKGKSPDEDRFLKTSGEPLPFR